MSRSPDDVRNELNDLYLKAKNLGGGWREVAKNERFKDVGIPFSTLCSIAGGGDIPKRWWKFFDQQSRGSKIYQELNEIAKEEGWSSWSEARNAIRDKVIRLPHKPQ